MKVFVSYVLAAMLIVRQCVYGIEDEMQLKQLRGSPVLKTFAEAMEWQNQNRNSGNAKRNDDGTYDGHRAWKTNQCVPTGNDCYVGDFCCESGETCPSCNVAPCKCLAVTKTGNKKAGRNRNSGSGSSEAKKFANNGGHGNENRNRNGSQCVIKGSDCFIGDICCNSGEACPSCNVAPCKC